MNKINVDIIKSLFLSSLNYTIKNGIKSYDPYDGLNHNNKLLKSTKFLRLATVYFNKFSPVNFRKLIGIKKKLTPHAAALLLKTLNNISSLKSIYKEEFKETHEYLVDFIISKSLKDIYGYHCWNGIDMDMQTLSEFQKKTDPGIVGTEICASALLEYYTLNPHKSEIIYIINDVKKFFLDKLYVYKNEIAFFKYKTITSNKVITYNTSALAAEFILKANNLLNLTEGNREAELAYLTIIKDQNPLGFWSYSKHIETLNENVQIDFHQGFILDTLGTFIKYSNDNSLAKATYYKGIAFYKNNQFIKDGVSIYRYPKRYPVNIQNQSQGIITFAKSSEMIPENIEFSEIILKWTIENMYNKRGFFYYLKYPFIKNKVYYLRWSQASMLYAISEYLIKTS